MPRRGELKPSLTAAAAKLDLRAPKRAIAALGKRQDWQKEAWTYAREIPEIAEAMRYRANQLGKVRLYVAVANPDDPNGDPVPANDEASGVPPAVAQAADAELARLRSTIGGQAEIMRVLDRNLEAVGEAYLIGIGSRMVKVEQRDGSVQEVEEPENWMIRSISEVEVKGSGAATKVLVKGDPNDTKGNPLDPDQDTWIRIWTRDPEWANQPESPMRSLLGECRIVQVLSQQLLAYAYRSLSAGILLVSNEASQGPLAPYTPEGGGDPVDPLEDLLYEVLSSPIENPSDSATVQPAILRAPKDAITPDVLRLLSFYDPALVAGVEERITARLVRIMRGMSLPVETIEGHAQTTFANAAQIAEDEWAKYYQPSAQMTTDALTYAFLRPQLRENPLVGQEWVDALFITSDPSDLIASPNTSETANDAWDRNAISNESYRKAKGFSEDDAPEPIELLYRAGLRRGILTADLTLALLNLLGVPIDVQLPDAASGVDPGNVDPAAAAAQLLSMLAGYGARGERARTIPALSAAARTDYGRQLVDIDRELRTRLLLATNAAMSAALDRAANRLTARTNGTPLRASLNNVPKRQRFVHLGPTLVAEAMGDEDPLSGAWDELEGQYLAWGADAQAQARSVTAAATGQDQANLTDQQSRDLTDSWAWFAAALTTVANERMWNPSPSAPEVGEFDPDLSVPPGMIRAAMARAGGPAGLSEGGTGAWVTLTDGGTRPAGGIATGETIRGALRDGGAGIEGYRWVYGPAYRVNPFPEHMALDGAEVVNFDDDSLSGGGWTGFGFWFPGDHDGCRCDIEPIVIAAAEAA